MQTATHTPTIIGHRGASGYRPEHTRSAYELAFALGADAVEPDIVATRDGVLVLRHENEISGTSDVADRPEFAERRVTKSIDGVAVTGWFTEDFTWAELSTLRARERLSSARSTSSRFDGRFPIIRMRDLFEIIDQACEDAQRALGVVAEFKHATYFESIGLPLDELFLTEMAAAGWERDDPRLTIESFELNLLDRFADKVSAPRVFLLETSGTPWDQQCALGDAARSFDFYTTTAGLDGLRGRVDGISVGKKILLASQTSDTGGLRGAELVKAAHDRGLSVFTWTLRPENQFLTKSFRGSGVDDFGDWAGEFAQVLQTGVDAIFVDHPDLGVEARIALAKQ